jgi:transcriptional regulator with GAF, ATPase, and Fis domain
MKGPKVTEARSLEDCIDAIAHLARVGRAGGAGGLRPETALEAIAVLAASLPEAIARGGRARALDLKSLPAEGIDLEAHLEAVGRGLMQEALDRCDGVQTKAAKLLRMSFRSFRYYREKYGLARPGEPVAENAERIACQ